MTLEEVVRSIIPADQNAAAQAKARWDSIAKPLGSLGALESAVIRMAAITGTPNVDISRRAVVVMCADNGVVADGVTQTGQEVTAIVAENMSTGDTSVCAMGRAAGVEIVPVDIGVATPLHGERILQRNIRRGTANLSQGPAMTREEAERAVLVGVEVARELCDGGVKLLGTGEMGIGNTTTSSAVAAVFLNKEPEVMTGRGAGLSSEGLVRKIHAIEQGIAVNRPDPSDPLDVLHKVGGLDLAGLAGVPGRRHVPCAGAGGRLYLLGGRPHRREDLSHLQGLYAGFPRLRRAGQQAGAGRAGSGALPLCRYAAGRGHRRGGSDAPAGYGPGGVPGDDHL